MTAAAPVGKSEILGIRENVAEPRSDLFDLEGAVRQVVREELAALLQPSQRIKDLHVGGGEQSNQLPGVIDGVRAAFPSLTFLDNQGLQGFPCIHPGRNPHVADDVSRVNGISHSGTPCVARALTRYVAGALLRRFGSLQRKAWVRRAAATRPSDTTGAGA